MTTLTTPLLLRTFENWHVEDHEMDACLDEIRDWMSQVSQFGIPRFGETATRLRSLHDRMVHHFGHEYELIVQLAETHSSPSPELDAVRRQAAHDHEHLLVQLHGLIERLDELDPPFGSWEEAMEEVALFMVSLQQHEANESDCLDFLMSCAA
jgi:hypothetical protein